MEQRDLMPPDPPLESHRVRLRPFRTADAGLVSDACLDPQIPRYTFMNEGLTEDEARQWIERSNEQWPSGVARFAIVDPSTDQVLGQVGMSVTWEYASAEAFYWLASSARGHGLASDALGLVADWAFDVVGIERLYLLIHPDNESSQRVASRCGFTREGVLRAYRQLKGGRPDMIVYSLLPSDAGSRFVEP